MESTAYVDQIVEIAGLQLALRRPRDPESLLSEEAFEHEEFLPYWAELWPSAVALARVLVRRPLAGVRLVELGCGLGVPSLVAAALGADVLATDWAPDALALLEANAKRNGLALRIAPVDWWAPGELLRSAPWELVLASDVLYERRNGDALLRLLPRLVDGSGEVLLAEPGRPPAAAFLKAAAEDWTVVDVAAEGERAAVYRLRKP